MVGLPCSGKTTLARQIERETGALRLTPDEWIGRLLKPHFTREQLDAMRDPVESLLWQVAEHVLRLGGDVILDFGFWSRHERDDMRRRATALGASCIVHFQPVDETVLIRRLHQRNANLPADCFEIDEPSLREWMRLFEPPEQDERDTDRA